MPGQRPITVDIRTARRLAIAKQHLSGEFPKNRGPTAIMSLLEDIRYLQLDPTSTVSPSHLLVLWSRLGPYRESDVDRLQWNEKKLFEYWAHRASIVLTKDYPLYLPRMKKFSTGDSLWARRLHEWMKNNPRLRERLLREITTRGPLTSRDFEDDTASNWARARKKWGLRPSAWSSGSDVRRMLELLFHLGVITVAGRRGRQKLWDLTERWLPEWTPREVLLDSEVDYLGAQFSLKALGVATPKQVAWHFLIGRHHNIKRTIAALEEDGKVRRVELMGPGVSKAGWYVHSDDIPLVESMAKGVWEPRTTLLSPFDNLIADRERTQELFDFFYRIEIYTPKEKRRTGFFVMPILQGDHLVGRIDPVMDRENEVLRVKAVHIEPGAKKRASSPRAISDAVESLGAFLGTKKVSYEGKIPEPWKNYLN